MYEACLKKIDGIDVAVFSAAVADYTPVKKADRKIKRTGEEVLLRLTPTKDIAAEMGKLKKAGQIFVGFALETEEGVEQAKSKLERKNLDLIVLNSLKDKGAGFGTDTNKVALIDKSGNIDNFEVKPKKEVAFDILDKTEKLMGNA
jgi:phosphopantothenoylcysteine decarboxylase/phosphopantothenate--cysteine ligase